jgi:hypothetical protein
MKKNRFIIGVLVLALMLMGAGYAAWSQTFDVDVRVNTGELAIRVEAVELDGNYGEYMTVNVDEKAITKNTKDNEILTKINNMYPGTTVEYMVTITNVGTLPVKLEDMVDDTTDIIFYDANGDVVQIDPDILAVYVEFVDNGEDRFEIKPGETDDLIYTISFSIDADDEQYESLKLRVSNNYNYIQYNQ